MSISGKLIAPDKFKEFVKAAGKNSDISDAKFWGFYSLCGFLLRLRSLYKFERGLNHWDDVKPQDIGGWIEKRHAFWDAIEEEQYHNLPVNGKSIDPFDAEAVNSVLISDGAFYGAGRALYGKPMFFTADLLKKDSIDGFDVFTTGREYARDISTHPAFLQNETICVRREMAELLLWDRFEEYAIKKAGGALRFAFTAKGIEDSATAHMDVVQQKMREITDFEMICYVRHELGEATEGRRLGPGWKDMLVCFSMSRASLFARAVKDVLADTCETGPIKLITDSRNESALGFQMCGVSGYKNSFSNKLRQSFDMFVKTGDWSVIDSARRETYDAAFEISLQLLEIFKDCEGAFSPQVESAVLRLRV